MGRVDPNLKVFALTSQLIEHELDRIEHEYAIDLQRAHRRTLSETDEAYYPQIETDIRAEAAAMAPHYEVFYSLETTIRRFIEESMVAAEGPEWWETANVPEKIKSDSEGRRSREIDTGMTPRSDRPLDFTTFGELAEIIKAHWEVFGASLSSQKAVERVMAMLNSLRGPIAHCTPLAEDEVVRLKLAVRDWFRLMG